MAKCSGTTTASRYTDSGLTLDSNGPKGQAENQNSTVVRWPDVRNGGECIGCFLLLCVNYK